MADLKQYIASSGGGKIPSVEELNAVLERYEWFELARVVRQISSDKRDSRLSITAPWRSQSSLSRAAIDTEAVLRLTADDIIDRFLQEEDLRIVAKGDETAEVVTEAKFADEDEVVSEDLAEIYLLQGLSERAVSIYRKLSLQNPEKSIYFAEQISKLENNN
jgi:hypothetical protein